MHHGLDIPNMTVSCKPQKVDVFRRIVDKTKRDRIRDQTAGMELGIIPLKGKDSISTTEIFWARFKYDTYPKMARQARIPKERPRLNWEGGIEKVYKESGIEWKGVRAIARDNERWTILCK